MANSFQQDWSVVIKNARTSYSCSPLLRGQARPLKAHLPCKFRSEKHLYSWILSNASINVFDKILPITTKEDKSRGLSFFCFSLLGLFSVVIIRPLPLFVHFFFYVGHLLGERLFPISIILRLVLWLGRGCWPEWPIWSIALAINKIFQNSIF